MKENKILIMGVVVAVLIVGGAIGYKKFSSNGTVQTQVLSDENIYPKVSILTIGQTTTPENTLDIGSGVSWAGEILSANDVNVQPKREGTIAEWNVKIGQKVYQGQTLGRLSTPPKTPDIVQAIALQAESLARAKAEAQAVITFNQKKIEQLNLLKSSYSDLKTSYSSSTLGSNTSSLTQIKKSNIQVVLQGSISKIYPTISANGGTPNVNSFVVLKWNVGVSGTTRNTYPEKIHQALKDLGNKELIPEASGLAYFEATVKLLSETIPDGSLDEATLTDLRLVVTTEQQEFITALKEYKEALVNNDVRLQETAGKNQDIIGKNQEIDAQIIQLEKDLALANAEVIAKQASYNSVVGGLTGGLEIVATKSGTISSISKRIGEFVRPEDTLASINGTNNNEKLIRFRIPSNAIAPKSGDILTVVRPGFLDTKIKIKVIGVGVSLDTNGSYMADAQFVEPTDWPVHASVRVIPNNTSSTTAVIPFTAIFWSDDGVTRVWTVTIENKLLSKEITAGRTFGDTVEITTGLSNGDMVVTRPIPDMKEGMLVSVSGADVPQVEKKSEHKEVQDESQPHSHDE
ncbi:MAG: biotin/lipoyl-binding protein [bacterium]|nr:biotin/lipoyl-binding protein [bacterium]